MTLVTSNDSTVVCRIQRTGEGRWISLALSLGDFASASRFLVSSERLVYEIAGVDERARPYNLTSWQGGVISGARSAFRTLKAPLQQVCLHELRGQLGSGDVAAISAAAALAVARLLGHPAESPLDLGGWTREEAVRDSPRAEGIARSANADSSSPAPLQQRGEDSSPASGNTSPKEGTQNLPAKPSAAADRPRE